MKDTKKPHDSLYLLLAGALCLIIIISLVISALNHTAPTSSASETSESLSGIPEFSDDDAHAYSEETFVSASLGFAYRSFARISNLELESALLYPSQIEAANSALIDFFSFAYPDISSLTAYNYTEEKTPVSEESSFNLSGGSHIFKVTFSAESSASEEETEAVSSGAPTFLLTILSESDQPLFSYSGENVFDFIDHSSESLATNLINFLPYDSYLNNGTPFSLYYFGDNDTLEIEVETDTYLPEFCTEAKQKSLAFLSSLVSSYSGKVSESNLTCINDSESF